MGEPATDDAGILVAEGRALGLQGRYSAALDRFERVVAKHPEHIAAWYYRGGALRNLHRHVDSLLSFDRAVALDPRFARGWRSHADALASLGEFDLACGSYRRAFEIEPGLDYLAGSWAAARAAACDWEGLVDFHHAIGEAISRGEPAALPGSLYATSLDGHAQRACAELHVARVGESARERPSVPEPLAGRRIRIAYVSADLRNHPVGYQVKALLRHHDRTRFEVHVASLQPSIEEPVQHAIRKHCDAYHDVSADGNAAAVSRLRSLRIDIAFDLQGFTSLARPGLFASRIAPVQATLFCPGTSGSRNHDYVIADRETIPDATEFTETVAYVPASHFVTDNSHEELLEPPSRTGERLPPTGVVFACFNASHKLDPETWDLWMSILQRVPDSTLWLGSTIPAGAKLRLRRAAEARRVDPSRLVMARRAPSRAEHLARHVHATACLDTRWYNGHTTTADALWMGVPAVTWRGQAFCGRVSASLLAAANLHELVATDPESYVNIACRLAIDRKWRATIQARLDEARESGRLFDAAGITRDFEALYMEMAARASAGEEPLALPARRTSLN